jgi:opacity protein-like surface antigen
MFSSDSGGRTLTGLLLGAGIENAFAPNWSTKLEYAHIDYVGRVLQVNAAVVGFGGPFSGSVSAQTDIAKAGINYRFYAGGPGTVVAKY